jgi:LPS sulfotransferase NodH
VSVEIKAVMLAHARSGSTMLMEFLNAQPDTSFAHEIFHREKLHLPPFMVKPGQDQAALRARRDRDPLGFLAETIAACPTRIFGFKWFRGHDATIRDHVVADPSWRVILLYRENFLALFASQRTARLTGRYIQRAGEPAPPPTLPFAPEEFLHEYELYRRFYAGLIAQCDQAGKAIHLVEYQHLSNPALLRTAARAIGIATPVAAAPRMVKQGTTRMLERFDRPDVVRATLERINRLHWLVEEDHFFALAPPPAA